MSETMTNEWPAIMSDYLKAMSAIEQRFQSGNEIPVPDARITRAEWEALDRYSLEDEARSTDAGMAYMHLEEERDALRAGVERLRASQQWQPIETAPKDSDVLLYCQRSGVVRGKWKDDRYAKTPRPYWSHDRERLFGARSTRDDQPTHWMPLPEPPAERGEG